MIKLADDAPEEFIDPISFLIMEDPVKVPTSRYIFDRNTLATHLAKDPSGIGTTIFDVVILYN